MKPKSSPDRVKAQAGVKTENQKNRYRKYTEQAEEARTRGRKKWGRHRYRVGSDKLATITETLGFK